MKKITLLGDSIFDNEVYVAHDQAVIDQINRKDKKDWGADLLAVDGAITQDVANQCPQINADTTHLIVSCGGNDALGYLPLFGEPVRDILEAMGVMAEIKAQFQKQYQLMVCKVREQGKHLVLCTIYDSVPEIDHSLLAALSIFNEVILKEAVRHYLPVLDLRLICNDTADYSTISPVEPSAQGGGKIIDAITNLLTHHDFTCRQSIIYT